MQPIGVSPTKTHTTTKQDTEYNTVIYTQHYHYKNVLGWTQNCAKNIWKRNGRVQKGY